MQMFNEKKVSLEKDLFERVKRFADACRLFQPRRVRRARAGEGAAGMKATDSDENIRKKLKGLGYIE